MALLPPPSTFRRKCSAFTIIELMIVIGVVAVLMALLLGVVPRISLSAKAALNLNHHRMITAALIRYAHEHRSTLPYSYQDSPEVKSMTYPRELRCLAMSAIRAFSSAR